MIWCNSMNYDTDENDQIMCNSEGFQAPFQNAWPCNLYRVRLHFICVDFGFFCYCRHFSIFKMPAPHYLCCFTHWPSLFQRRRWVSLWTHSSTVTRSTSRLTTGERWEWVEVNTVCCCWLDALWTAVPNLVHTRSLCEWLPYRNVWQKEEGWFVMWRAENFLCPRWLDSDIKLFTAVYNLNNYYI